tara:strand:- start:383 stop:748 length:366 start_codon:yes stop_codon:yes gene_type:complete
MVNPYPLMFSHLNCVGDLPETKPELNPVYEKSNDYQYFSKEEYHYSDYGDFSNESSPDSHFETESESENSSFKILGLKRSSSQEDIKKAFRAKALETHPDKTGDDGEEFRKVREAYECLIS